MTASEPPAVGAHTLRLQLLVGEAVIQGDQAKVTAFRWFGPLNVPEHAIYRYNVTGTLPEGAKWVDPTGGAFDAGEGTKDVKIKWGAGGVNGNGKANFQVDANYTWGLGVNVVEVKVEAPDEGDAFTAAARGVEGGTPDDALLGPVKQVFSGDINGNPPIGPGLRWNAKVTLSGPNGDRGVSQMRVGFIQNATISTLRAAYDGIDGPRVHGLQGKTFFDADPDARSRPWFKINDTALFSDPSRTKKVETIGWYDTPRMFVPVRSERAAGGNKLINRLDLVFDFDLFVAAATTDTRNDADEVHAKQASARWQWAGSQAIGGGPGYAWNAALSKVTPPTAWAPESDGTQPKKDEALGNTEIQKSGYWNTNWNP